MSQEVSLNQNDYKTVISWFDRLFGKGKEPDSPDKFTYQKLVVMAWAFTEEKKEMDDMRGGHGGKDDSMGR
jgi:hypothetical protein